MISYLYNRVKNQYYNNKPWWKLNYKIAKILINILYPFINRKWNKVGVNENSEIIVSLTSFPARINTVWRTIVTLLDQDYKPQRIILWLSKEQFETVELPNNLLRLKKFGLEIRFCEDLKPHKKYYYSMQEYPDKCIVIADDDIYYPQSHLKGLWEAYQEHKNCIVCHRTHYIEFNEKGNCKLYEEWSNKLDENPSFLLLPIGCNGVLYPPKSLSNEVFNYEYIINNVLYTDDLWLKVMAVLNYTKTYSCKFNELVYFDIIETRKTGLWRINTVGDNRNDLVWEKLMHDYSAVYDMLLSEWNRENDI